MAEHGGQRTPAHPAAVSGPGALSARTDGGATSPPPLSGDGSYGDTKDIQGIESGAAMRGGPSTGAMIPFGAPTQNPQEPVTAGAAAGPGIGPQAAGIQNDTDATLDQLKPLQRSLDVIANLPSTSQQTRAWVRALKAQQAGR